MIAHTNKLKNNINEINKFNNNNNILKIKNKTKIDYDIESISKETTLKGLFAREIIEKIKNRISTLRKSEDERNEGDER